MGIENVNLAQDNTGSEGEPERVTDPAEDFTPPTETPEPHDDVDVALQEGKDTADGEGDEEKAESDFQSYADPTAEKEETN